MKKYSYFIVAILLTITLSHCLIQDRAIKLLSSVKINDSIYFDLTEIDVEAWLSFYTWTLEHDINKINILFDNQK